MSNECHYKPAKDIGVGSACCKLILAGEHMVIYGFPGLAVPLLDHITRVELIKSSGFEVFENGHKLEGPRLDEVKAEIEFVFNLMSVDPECVDNLIVQINYGADPGVGMGVSASFAVALIRAVSDACGLNLAKQDEIPLAELIENRYHGVASGLDHITIIHEKPILWKGPDQFEILDDIDFTNTNIWRCSKIKNTGRPMESTKEMIEFVASKISPEMKSDWETLSEQMPNLINAIKEDDLETFSKIINRYGEALEAVPVVNEEVQTECQNIRSKGGAAKICGAGGFTEGSGVILIVNFV